MLQLFFNKIHLKPATLAVLIQVVAFFFVFSLDYTLQTQSLYVADAVSYQFSFYFVLMQASVAVYLAYVANMAKWWRWIHFTFPMAVWLMSEWQISNTFYLIGFLLSLSLYWTTFRTQVPFYPSMPIVWQQVLTLIPAHQSMRIVDIGSGLGDMSMFIAEKRPDCLVDGTEIAPLPWLVSAVRSKFKGSRVNFKLGDYHALDFADYDIVFAYLSPAAMPALWQKVQAQMRTGCLLVSYEFEIEGVEPTKVIQLPDHQRMLYVWEI
ncbi:class I SAM-dependent methyltransferase [Methylotenera mobilis]|uniref:Class I SAM-dependent methyltransferase n=1 Tax=Methylotenera mobilis (strain JLW8 / ATCC BAA-1282 / DSM 17540) TaxID=583345 RepID=C6WW71_METML|nr:class I SAM-dependent methyltransferase [Methylotenera mobilis]ACT48170.1 hypothetical protein Mmol_1264 [Methylotenera mobilis JLW8]